MLIKWPPTGGLNRQSLIPDTFWQRMGKGQMLKLMSFAVPPQATDA